MLKNPVSTVHELLPKLNNANAYSFVKVYKRFTNVELDKSSSFLNTMKTPNWPMSLAAYAIHRQFEARAVSETRQRKALGCLTGIVNNANDILVFGCGDRIGEAEKDHDIILWNLMLSCCEVNLKLNPKKFPF